MAQGFSFADAFRPPNQSQDQELGGFSFADALGKQEPTEQPVSPENLAAQPGTYVSPGGAAFVPPRSGRRPTPEAGGGRGFVNPPLVGQPQPDYTIARPEQPRPYKDKREALDDAVNLLEEGADRAKLVEAFGRMGIPWNEIVQHGQKRNSEYFRQQVVPPAQPGQPTLPVQPTGEIRAWEPGFLEKTANVFKRADASFKDMATSFLFSTGAFNADQTAWMLRNNARQRAAAAPSEDIQRGMEAIGRSKTYGEAAEAMLRNPKATMSMLVDSLLVTAPTLAATLALAPAGVAVRAGTTFAGSGSMEYTSVMTDVLQDKGIDLTDAPKVARALQDPKIIAEMKEKGAKRGLIVGAFDALSMGLAGRFMRPANELIAAGKLSGSAAKKATVAAWGKELALQVGAGGGGEFVAQKATGDNKPADVLMEALAEGVMAPVDVAAALREARLSTPEAQIARAIDLGVAETQFTPEGIRREAAGAAGGVRPMTIAELVRAAPVAVPAAPEPPEAAAPPEPAARVEPALGEPSAAPAGRVEPALGEPPSEPGGRVEPTLTFVPLSEEPGGRVEPTLGEGPVAEGPVRRFEPLAERAPGQVQAIPGMPTGEELAEPEVTPVTPASQAPTDKRTPESFASDIAAGKRLDTPEDIQFYQNNAAAIENELNKLTTAEPSTAQAPTVTFRPTPAAAALPDTPTVAPFTTPQIFEPPPVGLEADEWPSINVPVADLKLSKDVPQFKLGADVRGVVEPLGGTFDKRGVAPIQVWRRLDGSLEVISGRHRFDLAQRSGTKLIAAQIYDEAAGFDKLHAAILDAELNIRDGQGKVKDYVNYFKESGIDRDTAESKGLLARATGKRSYTIANQGSDELIAAVRSDQIGDEAAYYVALNAPGDARLQSVGIKAIMDGKSMNTATNMMQAVKALAGENDTTVDMFGFDDSAMREAEEMAKIAAQKQREIQARLSAISGASKNPKLAAEEGIDIRNPEEVKRRIDELRQKKSAWDNWSTNSDLVAEIRAARGVAPPPVTAPPPAPAPAPALELTAPTPQELRTQEEGREQAEEKAIVDREVDLFQLQPQVAEREAPPEADLFAGEAAPSAEYQAALEKSRRAGEAFRRVQEAYRKQQISDEDFLAGRREYDRAMAEFDRATRKERGEPEPVAEREEGPEPDSLEYIISMPRFKYREDEDTRGMSSSPALRIDTAAMTPEGLLSKYGEKNVRLLAGLYGIKVKDPKNLARKLIDLRTAIAEASVMTEPQLNSMKLPELKEFAKEIGSPTSGNKPQIIQGILKFAPSTIKLFNDRLQDSKHRTAVLRAAREGKPIKDEVLKDYPDIAVYVYERGTDNYKKAISALALKYRPSVGMEMKTVAEGFRKDAQETEDAKEREVFNDIADEMDRQYEATFGKGAEPTVEPGSAPDENDTGFRGASDEEVGEVADAFKAVKTTQDEDKTTRVFDPPAKSDVVRIEDKVRIFTKDAGYLTVEQAKQRIEQWKQNAQSQGEDRRNAEKIVLSLFDMTGEWSKPWEEAGYQVYRFDIQTDPEFGDVNRFSSEFFNDIYGAFEGQDVYAILAACPCTDFASSGARHFAAKDADGRTIESVQLVQQTLATIEYFKPSVWAIENPVGRIEKLTGLPPWRMSFNPNHFGDPYTKKTLLWGRFNANLPVAPVEPTEGSKMHRMYGGKSQETKNARSVTPEGFAYAFFQANNAIDNPVMAIANKYDMMDPGVFREALAAGMSEKQISDIVDDPYYFSLDYRGAEASLMAAVQEMGAAPATDAQIKNETEFLQETTQNALEAIQEDFMVGDLVRFGNMSGVVIGLEGDYARFRPDGARSPKAYQRVPKKSLTFVSRPDTTSEVSYSKEQDNKFGDEAGQLNADKSNLIRLLGANMYQSSLSDVAIKELLQNAFDAVKGATASVNAEGKKIKPIYKTGNIEITIDRENRTISVKDDARGMTPDIVRKAFFTIAGSDKSDLPPELRSGGLGLAKMGFMLGSETLQLDTVRDGVRVTVDASAADIASDNFKIKKAPAPKGEHGTTVTVKIPENYIDPKTGDPKPIYFPYSLKSVDAFEKPLVGPVELKVTLKGFGSDETSVLPVGINFPQDKYTKFKANFDWGSADIYFSVARSEGRSWSIKHQVLSSGVYQFSPDFTLDNEKIPYDIIVDVKPNVDARHPDYPFENSRERFKGRLEKDVEALTMYLGQIARGYEARDLQESFKGVVSMPRVEAGAEIAGIAEKLKKTFGTQAAAKPAELKPLPKEITVTADSVTDTKTQQILVDVKAKEAEKKKEATFKGEAAPKALDFMIELKQDPKLPVFHNNTNVDFLAIGRPYGEPEKFFAELGTLLVEMKEEMAKSGMYGYEKLAPENLFFAGVSIDKQYGGVHIKVPYKAVFINPFYSFGARTLFGVRQQLLNTMIHEIAHTGSMDHGVAHNTNMVKVEQYLSDEGLLDYYRDALLDILRRHESAFTAMREAYGQSTTRNTSKSLEDYGKDAAAASAGGDRGGAEYAPSAVSARGRPERGAGVPEAEAAGREGAVGRGAGEPAVIEVDGVSRPTTNNRGQRIHPTDEGLRNFWRWFGDSQVVDSQGRPLVVYHGTGFTQAGDAITTFQISAGLYGAGAYFSGNPERAASYARAGQGTIYPVYVRLVNPISIDGYIERFEGTTRSADRAWDARQELLNDGVDGVLSEPRGPTRFWEVVAFNENQIKSAVGNLGTFSPTSPSILENIEPMAEPSLAEQEGDLIFGREALREYQIKEYAKLRRELGKVPKKVAAGEAGIDMQRNVTRLMQAARELQASIRGLKPRRDSAEVFLAKALTEYDAGNLERDVLDVIQTAYQRAPELLEGLLLQVRSPAKPGISRSAGDFNPWKRAITLYKGTSGVTEAATIRHELAHTLEQMMTPEQRMAVVQAWGKALQRAIKQNPDELHQRYFKAILDFLDNPTERRLRAAQSALPSYDMYQFINPSEFWAVNAEKLMAAELGSAWDKFKRAMRKMLEGIKKVLGFDNRYDVHKAFNQVMGGSKERITDGVLVDMVKGTGGDFILLSNIEDDKKLVQKYNRPNTPMLDTSPIKTFITKQFQNGKEFLQDVAENPREAMAGKGDSVIDGLIYLRNKNVWYGSGLEARDFDKYNGELTTAEGVATASVALDNAIRSGNIGVEVIFRGGIEYDPKSNNFVAVRRNLGMKGVYEAEAKMKRKLGNQLGTDIIQGYLEAKRSISIMDELYDRGAAYEAAKDNLQAMKDMGADADQIAQAKDAVEALAKELEAIKKAASSVNMSEEEMYEFASLDEKHPELRDLMDNWTAINQNLLKFWRQVGLLSQGRYETLAAIKDYVPWYRIMEDELDLHDADQSAVQSTTRSMTNIGREKLFKRGKPLAVVDFRAQAGQKDFKIQPSSVVKVEVNGDPVDPDLVTVTPTGEVRLDMDLQDNDLVVFTTNREIQNIIDNMTRNVMRMTMNGIRQFAANRIVLEYASRDAKNKIMVFPSVDKEKGRFNWIVNGKKVVVEIQDPLVAASIYGMENLNLRMWAPLAAVANLTRRSITLSGVFQIKQVFKDAPTAAIVTGVKNPLALIGGVWKGFLTSLTNTDPAVDILKAAGIGGFMSPARTPEAEIKRRLGIMNRNVFSAVIKGLDHIGDSSDMAQRVATYKRVLAETGDETQALYQAANVINFLHHGSAGYAQAVVKVVPFMGAYANAMDVLVRALVGGGLKGMSRKKALARLAITMSLLTGATLLYAMLAGGDPEYDELDDQTKLKNIIIPGTKIMLPMNTSAAYFFKAIPELIYNAVTREGTENEMDRRRIRKALADSARDMLLGPEPLPAGVKPVLEVAINHDFFTGRPVIPEGLKDVAAAEQYTASTSELGKKISAMLEIPGTDGKRVISPIEADHLVRGIFGTAGAMGQWVSNSIGTIAETRPEPTAREMPITGSFLRDEIPRGREDLFYDFKEVVFEKYKTWQKMVDREDFEGADKYIEKHGDVAAMYEYINETEAELKEINSEIRRLGETRSKDESPKERRQQIDDYKRLRQEILEPVKELRREVLR